MKHKFINHHLFQAGDTYGLIYALLLNREIGGRTDVVLHALFWIDGDLYQPGVQEAPEMARQYTRRIEDRLGYLESFDLFGTSVTLVSCRFSDLVDVVELHADARTIYVTANASLFHSNPRLVSLFLTKAENDPPRWLQRLDDTLEIAGAMLRHAASVLQIARDKPLSGSDEQRLVSFAKQRYGVTLSDVSTHVRKIGDQLRVDFADIVSSALAEGPVSAIIFGYISDSTDYVVGRVKSDGYIKVASILRRKTFESTSAYRAENEKFITKFAMEYQRHKGSGFLDPSPQARQPVIVLFWIRGARPDEESAILRTFDPSGEHPSPGKPQHHTNFTLYTQLRAIIKELAAELKQPFLFIPIGDELKEDFGTTLMKAAVSSDALRHAAGVLGISADEHISTSDLQRLAAYLKVHYGYSEDSLRGLFDVYEDPKLLHRPTVSDVSGYRKAAKPHNLIQFFGREPFKGKPMGAQMEFLMQFASRYQVIQIGMRSGSMERLMYMGVPTIYFDRTTGPSPPVGAKRIKQLCGFQDASAAKMVSYFRDVYKGLKTKTQLSGYPLFFQIENRDTGFLRYSSLGATSVRKAIDSLMTQTELIGYNDFKQQLAAKRIRPNPQGKLSQFGGLVDEELQKFVNALWFISFVYPRYAEGFSGLETRVTEQQFNGRIFLVQRRMKEEERRIAELREERRVKKIETLGISYAAVEHAAGVLHIPLSMPVSGPDGDRLAKYLQVHYSCEKVTGAAVRELLGLVAAAPPTWP